MTLLPKHRNQKKIRDDKKNKQNAYKQEKCCNVAFAQYKKLVCCALPFTARGH